MITIDEEIEAFATVIKSTDIYRDYVIQKEQVKAQPGLKQQIDEFREKNFALQNLQESDEIAKQTDALSEEYAIFRENPVVDRFLAAELSFCRMMQKIYTDLSEKVEFE
ncbi:MAG: YlbF family regulator [Lachnospiraceae bacterium]